MSIKKTEIFENLIYVTDKNFVFSLDDEKERQFGVLFEITDMYEATDDEEFKSAPFIVSAVIMADKCHRSFNESDNEKPSKQSLMFDAHSYMGGVPVDHVLTDAINGGLLPIAKNFDATEAIVITQRNDFGTVAAQRGQGSESKHLRFLNEAAARKFVDLLIKDRVGALGMMIGFILDRPINMIGETGWSVLETQVKGRDQK